MQKNINLRNIKYRSDIDGLRAIAVLAVVLYHAFPDLVPGGFIGVDVFFVISGYLITYIIFDGLHNKTFGFHDFYIRRINRIFPALILVLVACLIFGWFACLAEEYKELGKHVAAGAIFISNIVLWKELSYFDINSYSKPLLHLWSLGVEEQFYLSWPFSIYLIWNKKFSIFYIAIGIIALSFAINVYTAGSDPSAAFYLPQTRIWEFLCGSLVAWHKYNGRESNSSNFVSNKLRIYTKTGFVNCTSFFGFLSLVLCFFFINDKMNWPGWLALLPVIGTTLLISGDKRSYINHFVLSNRVSVWIGLISYPLYLWHYPLLSFSRIINGELPTPNFRVAVVTLSIFLAWLTYKYVEVPIRRSSIKKVQSLIFALCLIAVGSTGFYIYRFDVIPEAAQKAVAQSRQIGWEIPAGTNEQIRLCQVMFPDRDQLTPSHDNNFCYLQRAGVPNILLVGDSGSLNIFPGLSQFDGFDMLVLSASAAAPLYNTLSNSVGDSQRKLNYKLTNQALDYAVNNDNIKVVVLSFLSGPSLFNANNSFKISNVSDPTHQDTEHVFAESLKITLDKLLKSNKKVLYVLPNPDLGYEIRSCLNAYRPFRFQEISQNNCAEPAANHLKRGGQKYRDLVHSVLVNYPQVEVFDLATVLCDSDRCWGMKDNHILYRDGGHMSDDGSLFVAPYLHDVLKSMLST